MDRPEELPKLAAEMRQVTMMFCDLVDSTSIVLERGAQGLRDVYEVWHSAASASIYGHSGFIALIEGDSIFALFGYPNAREDAPACAVRAALDLMALLKRVRAPQDLELRARVGIATGTVLVGDLVGGAFQGGAAIGLGTVVAKRLQQAAGIGEVLIASETQDRVAGMFETEPFAADLKGVPGRVPYYRVVRSLEVDRPGPSRTPMVGRQTQLAQLESLWRQARTGRGQAVIVRAEAGTGKTRLVDAFLSRIEREAGFVVTYTMAQRFTNTALHPVIRRIERVAGFAAADSADDRLVKLESLVRATVSESRRDDVVRYTAALLGIPFDHKYAPIALAPEVQRDRTLDAMRDNVDELTRAGPLLVVFEDMHWADPTTRELLARVVAKLADRPAMVVVTTRPETTLSWQSQPHATSIELGPLDHDDTEALVRVVAEGALLTSEIVRLIVKRSDGLPLYAEELVKMALRAIADGKPFAYSDVPPSLADLLLSKLDRTGPAKVAAQAAAVIGREFDTALVAHVLDVPLPEAESMVKRLEDGDIVEARGDSDPIVWSFRHALIQDAAYKTLPRDRRRPLHLRVAQGVEAGVSSVTMAQPEVLAIHYAEAGLPHLALPYRQAAGAAAMQRAAFEEASGHHSAALELVAELPDGVEKLQAELGARLQHGLAVSSHRGYAATEVAESYGRAKELCDLFGNVADLFPVLRGLWAFYIVRGDTATARDLAQQCMRLGEETQRVEFLAEGHVTLGYTRTFAGELVEAAHSLRETVRLYRENGGEKLVWPAPQDACVAALSLLSHNLLLQGDLAGAREASDDSIRTANALGRPYERAFAYTYAAMFEQLQDRWAECVAAAEIAIGIAQEHKIMIWLACAQNQWGVAKAMLGESEAGIATAEGWLAAYHAMGGEINAAYVYAGLAQAYSKAGNAVLARERASKALELCRKYGERYLEGRYEAVQRVVQTVERGHA
jgi:class 3 adenylate cyclase/tetratricopeptide (TPR) repeat protein